MLGQTTSVSLYSIDQDFIQNRTCTHFSQLAICIMNSNQPNIFYMWITAGQTYSRKVSTPWVKLGILTCMASVLQTGSIDWSVFFIIIGNLAISFPRSFVTRKKISRQWERNVAFFCTWKHVKRCKTDWTARKETFSSFAC